MHSLSCLLIAAFCLTAFSGSRTARGATPGEGSSLSWPSQSGSPIVGTWEATQGQLKTGAVGLTLLFSAEGTLTAVAGLMVDGKYKLDGNQLRVDAPGAVLPDVQMLAFVGDTVVITGGANYRKLIPFGARAQPNSLVGQWRWIDSTGMTGYEEYTVEGTWRLRAPVRHAGSVSKGFYSVRGNTITMRFLSPQTEERSEPFTLRGNTLTIRGKNGQSDSFVRARPLLPTDVEQPSLPIR